MAASKFLLLLVLCSFAVSSSFARYKQKYRLNLILTVNRFTTASSTSVLIFWNYYEPKPVQSLRQPQRAKQPTPQFTFKVTALKGNFDQVKEMCRADGGTLIHSCLGPKGSKYHRTIRRMVRCHKHYHKGAMYWVGLQDRGVENRWQTVTGERYNAQNRRVKNAYYWRAREPNNVNGGEHCGSIKYGKLNDALCHLKFYGVCEYQKLL